MRESLPLVVRFLADCDCADCAVLEEGTVFKTRSRLYRSNNPEHYYGQNAALNIMI
jgi:hypothetical protein